MAGAAGHAYPVHRGKLLRHLAPFLDWLPKVTRATLRPDLEAGLIGAILILPQSIALATLAGMPPEYGIYTSIFPVIIASVWGSSWHTLSGPNTAVCVLIAFSVAPFASIGTEHYIGYVLALTFMVGVVQLLIGFLKFGAILDFISHTVINAIVFAVALIIIVSAAAAFLGVLANIDEPFFVRLYQVIHDLPRANPWAVAVGTVTVVTGLAVRRINRRYSLVIAVVAGTAFSMVLNLLFGSANTNIEMLGNLSLSLLPLSMPSFNLESLYVLKTLVTSALAIAFLGLMQTVVISRSIAMKSNQPIDTNQEIIGQGFSNIVAPFFSSFAGSGSFNRSAAHYEAGAITPMAAVYASVLLALIVVGGTSLIAYLPMATVAGALILVGYGLIDLRDLRLALRSRPESLIYFATLVAALVLGLNSGVFIGLLLSLLIYMWHAAAPNLNIEMYTARNGQPVQSITIDGNLFFGSVRHIEKAMQRLATDAEEVGVLLIRTDHLTYMDVSGANLVAAEIRRQQARGGKAYVYITRDWVIDVLDKAGLFITFGRDWLIERNKNHPMKDILNPYNSTATGDSTLSKKNREDITMEELARHLGTSRLLGPLSLQQLQMLLEQSSARTAAAGDIIINSETGANNHLVLLDGEIEVQRTWQEPDSNAEKSYTRNITPATGEGSFAFLGSSIGDVRVRAVSDIRYLLIDADVVDDMIGWEHHFTDELLKDPETRRRMQLVKSTSVFHRLPLENVITAFERMQTREARIGEDVVTQGEAGDAYYIIDEGDAEVMRTDPFTDETSKVAVLGSGDAFGEEALLQGGYRNATITMTTPGKLLFLTKDDFDELVKPNMVSEIDAESANKLLQDGDRELIDCRYDMEFEESRIPGAQWTPLDDIRLGAHQLDPNTQYIVYCRSGRRSKAAAFLLRERNIDAVSLTGGIKDWPYEVDSSPVDASSTA